MLFLWWKSELFVSATCNLKNCIGPVLVSMLFTLYLVFQVSVLGKHKNLILQDASKIFFEVFLLITFWRYPGTSTVKSQKEVTNSRNEGFFLLFFLNDRRIRIRIRTRVRYLWLTDPDPGGPKTYGSDRSGSATLLGPQLCLSHLGYFKTCFWVF